MSSNIFPEFHRLLGAPEKEQLLQQKGGVFWFFGLSGSGKSTLANAFERYLHSQGRYTVLLDGDNLRSGLCSDLGFGDAARRENIRRASEVAKILVQSGVITLASFITPKRELRKLAEDIIGKEHFHPIYVKAGFQVCAARDVKGLYAQAATGNLTQFTGKDSSFEEAEPDEAFVINTEEQDLDASLVKLIQHAEPRYQTSLG